MNGSRAVRPSRIAVVALLTFAGLLVPGIARAAACLTVSSNTTLSSDITDCADNGIEITKSNVTLKLNGHTIDGDDDAEDVGILVNGKSGVTIVGPGTITQFGTGIRVNDANNTTIKNTTVTDNNDDETGIVVTQSLPDPGTSEGTVIEDNTVTNNAGSGIVVYRSSKVTKIRNNTIEDNLGDGIFLGGAGENTDIDGTNVDPDDFNYKVTEATISGNTVDDNSRTGITIDATGKLNEDTDDDGGGGRDNVIRNNTVTDSGLQTVFGGAGHEGGRSENDKGGSGIKVVGKLKNTTIDDNTSSTNGNPATVNCFDRNGAGILVAGGHNVVNITNNEANGNAMSGVFVAGHNKSVKIANNTLNDNLENCDSHNAGAKITGVHNKTKVNGNDLTGNDGNGIEFSGHNKGSVIKNNIVDGNTGAGGNFGDQAPTAAIHLKGRSLSPDIISNTANSQTDDVGLGHGIFIEGSFVEVLLEDNTADGNEGSGITVSGQGSKPCNSVPDGDDPGTEDDCIERKIKDPTPESADIDCNDDTDNPDTPTDEETQPDIGGGGFGGCRDVDLNKTSNVKAKGNTTNSNGTDGLLAITDIVIANHTANSNNDFGIEHEDDATVRGGDAGDGPHLLKDGGGNSATGNGTDCSPGLSC